MPQTLMPHSVETEQALLGTLIVNPERMVDTFDSGLKSEDFYSNGHKKIFAVLDELYQENTPIDMFSVMDRLKSLNLFTEAGGAEYLARLTDMAVSSGSVAHYVRIIQEKATLRRLIETCQAISEDSFSNSSEFDKVLADAEHKILNITRDIKTGDFVDSEAAMRDVLDEIRERQNRKGMTGVPSGYKILDRYTNGFQKGDLIILAARPSVGKTAFALNIAYNASVRHGSSVAVFSLEMPVRQLGMRLLSIGSQVDSRAMATGMNLKDSDIGKLNNAAASLSKAKMYFDDSPTIKVNEIFAKCRKLKADSGLDLVIIDYLQLIAPSGRSIDSRQQEVSEISRSLKALAREMEIPVIALSQLNRSVEQRQRSGTAKPMLSDLRESGSIEQDADIVMFLHRPGKSENENGEQEEENTPADVCFEEDVIIGKHRNGQIGEIGLMFQPNINTFFDKDYSND